MTDSEFKAQLIELFKKDRMTYPVHSKGDCLTEIETAGVLDETLNSKKMTDLITHLSCCLICVKELKIDIFLSRGICLEILEEAPGHLIDWEKVFARPNLDKEWEHV